MNSGTIDFIRQKISYSMLLWLSPSMTKGMWKAFPGGLYNTVPSISSYTNQTPLPPLLLLMNPTPSPPHLTIIGGISVCLSLGFLNNRSSDRPQIWWMYCWRPKELHCKESKQSKIWVVLKKALNITFPEGKGGVTSQGQCMGHMWTAS